MTRPVPRRRVLSALGALVLAGCPSLSSDRPTPRATPAATRTDEAGAGIDILTDYADEAWFEKWESDIVPGWAARSEVPVRIEVPPHPEDAREALESPTPPELYHGDMPQIADFVARGETRPVDDLVADLVSANGDLVLDESMQADGAAHIVPHGLYLGGVLNYRRDVYDALGLSVPATWDELLANAAAIDAAESFDMRGFAVPAKEPRDRTKGGQDLLTWLYNAGGGLWRGTDGTVELDFHTADVRSALELMRELARYSPEAAEVDYPETIVAWLQGNVGQCLFPNAWLAGLAHQQDRPLASDTAVAVAPRRDRSLDPSVRGWSRIDGAAIFREAESTGPAAEFLRYVYEGPDRQAAMNLVEPMRFLPPYEDVLGSEVYRSAPIFQAEDGYFLELNEQCLESIAPHHGGNRPRTAAAWYAMQEPILSELVREVIVAEEPIDAAIDRARSRLSARLEAGQQLGFD